MNTNYAMYLINPLILKKIHFKWIYDTFGNNLATKNDLQKKNESHLLATSEKHFLFN